MRRFSGLLAGAVAGVSDTVGAGEEAAPEPDASADADREAADGDALTLGAGVEEAAAEGDA
ncbi:hypothetical protein GCM10022403_034150 [Streptomyces coacervatus]|uniref:Uncharacterized protein n=1 Tax=Streptomyces coacervatus TaxID=647381 RepID=A0ABP7HTB6_9ACTN